SELNVSRWLEAHSNRSAGLTTLPGNAILVDVVGDGDYRLIITDLKLEKDVKSRLKTYKGTLLTSDQILQDIPSSVVSFFTDEIEPRIPAVAVACGSDLLIFKNSKPFFKFTVPSLPITPLESEIWKKFAEDPNCDFGKYVEDLKTIPYNVLSPRSQHLLCEPPSKIEEFIGKYLLSPPSKNSTITCMTSLNRMTHDKYGLYDVEYRVVAACREGHVCVLRRGWLEGKSIIQSDADIVDMVLKPGDNFIILATTDKMLHCYTKRGQRLWSSKMANSITCLALVTLNHLSSHLVAVGLKGGPIHLYQGRHPVDYTSVPDTPSVITFGQLGQEEHVMVIITLAGTINFKILKRTADFNLGNPDSQNMVQLQGKPLPLPKRSKLFLEQSLREKQSPIEMHQNFQQDLIRLRLTAARSLVQSLSDQSGVGNEKEQIKLSAQVLGLGPKFTLILTLVNMNNEKCLAGFTITYHTKPTLYTLSSYINLIPLIPPGLSFQLDTKIEEIINEQNQEIQSFNLPQQNGIIRVFVTRKGQSQPVLAATINMPPTELPYVI
ncbi:unnamed protein product, partial [Brassicogethes aeneus]